MSIPIPPATRATPTSGRKPKKAANGKGTAKAPREVGESGLEFEDLRDALRALKAGDFSVRITPGERRVTKEVATAFNDVAAMLDGTSVEFVRVSKVVGRDGEMMERAQLKGAQGGWSSQVESFNALIGDLVRPSTEVARVIIAVAAGDLSQKMALEIEGKPVRGEFLRISTSVNTMVDQLRSFASDVTRVAKEVGTEGKLGGQAEVKMSGTWKDLTENVNLLAGNLTAQVRNIALVTTAVANGDLSQKITVDARGELLELKSTINTMVDQLSSLASEVMRVAKEVGTEGKLGGKAQLRMSGTWKDLTDGVNVLADNLTSQVRNIALVTTAVANGDLSQKIAVDARGELLELKTTVNKMVDQLSSFASEVTRVAKEVGTDGKLGGQAEVKMSGTWKDLTDNVNRLAWNLTSQVRNIALVTTAVANGDLSQKIDVEARGELLELKTTVNKMVDQLSSFAGDVTRVAKEVGTDGKLGGQAEVKMSGTWKDLTDNVNRLAWNLTSQVRNIALVTTAVANGDLSQKIDVEARGELLELKTTVNKMVDQLSSFAGDVTRVAKEVGTDGKLGGQAEVKMSGTWKDLTDNVNRLAGNLTSQVRNIALVTTAVANGDLSQKIDVEARGELLELKTTVNKMVDQLSSFAGDVTRVAKEVGTDGKLGGQAEVKMSGTWKDLTDNVNRLAGNLTAQVRNIALVTTAVANGDLSQKIDVEARGEMLELKTTVNKMVDQLSSFAGDVTRVAKEVGTDGKLGGQAEVKMSGTWKDLTDNVNRLAGNLTAQVRNIALVTTAVANGDLSQKIDVEARGELLELKTTVNKMVDQLNAFASEVTRVAREVGTEGKLGGQAKVPGAAGTWRDLTDNVNQLANNLTGQVRAIMEVSIAVTQGDLTRSISVEAQGEVLALRGNLNQMIANLRDTTLRNEEQDWLKTNLAKFSGMMQGQKNLEAVSRLIMSELTPLVSAHHGAFFIASSDNGVQELRLRASYAYQVRKNVNNVIRLGDGLVGQSALEKKAILLTNVPSDYVQISSGLGQGTPLNILVIPILFENEVSAVIELASFQPFSEIHRLFLDQLSGSIGVVLNMIGANMRTVEALNQSQSLAEELQTQSKELQQQQSELKKSNQDLGAQAKSLKISEDQLKDQREELQQVNEQLEEKASLLAGQNRAVENKNKEVELARLALEEKAEQLALSSKYKSEFLANMSHELRTPLNSLLILSQLLADNPDGNLEAKQVEFATTIHAAGADLLSLINDILDLSKIESGTMAIDLDALAFASLPEYVERNFGQLARHKGLAFHVVLAPDLPASISTDPRRLQQVLKNLLANAFKFTEHGSVTLEVALATSGWSTDHSLLGRSSSVLAFSVTDTGIGIAVDKQKIIFHAFQQADGTTSRKYGGTGLGLSISREIARLLGGEIRVHSAPGEGSTFTLYLPVTYAPTPPSSVRHAAKQGAEAAPGVHGPASLHGAHVVATKVDAGDVAAADAKTPPAGAPATIDDDSALAALSANVLGDDRSDLKPGAPVLLVIEDDAIFAGVLFDRARAMGFQCLGALSGEMGLSLADQYKPDAVTLDLGLPGVDGWIVLDRLKHSARTRHIPVHVISADDSGRRRALRLGARNFMTKPVTNDALTAALGEASHPTQPHMRRLLLVEDNEVQSRAIVELIGSDDVTISAAASGEEALSALAGERFDCMVLDLGLPDMTGFELIDRIEADPRLEALPVIVYTGRDMTREEKDGLTMRRADVVILKDVHSMEHLLEQTALFLHRNESQLSAPRQKMLKKVRDSDPVFAGKTVLVIDDDVRNIFAVTSVLERHKMTVLFAKNGKKGIEVLVAHPAVQLVLMDIMMPEMDGYEATRAIRAIAKYETLPIVALTAKAMKDDRQKCLDAGASDYITKPVDAEALLSILRVWLY